MSLYVGSSLQSDYHRLHPGKPFPSRLRCLLAIVVNPSCMFVFIIRLQAATNSALLHSIFRRLLIHHFSSDVSGSVVYRGPIAVPHPVGIVLGRGVTFDGAVTLYQNVTIGNGYGGYPTIGDNVVIYAGAVIAGAIGVGHDVVIGANSVVLSDVSSGRRVRGGARV